MRENGNGAPDASIWNGLSDALGADILKLLQGELGPNRSDVGKMDRIRFYVCPVCGNILTSTGKATVSCCGRRLQPLNASEPTGGHNVTVEEMDSEYYISLSHEMTKEHYISFTAYVYDDRVWFQRLYPEQSSAFRLTALHKQGALYLYCTKHGLFRYAPQII